MHARSVPSRWIGRASERASEHHGLVYTPGCVAGDMLSLSLALSLNMMDERGQLHD